MSLLKFSKANAKIAALSKVEAIKPYLENKRKIYSFDLLSGWTCPGAKDCLSKVRVAANGRRSVHDGPQTEFRCFSASQEALHTNVYNARKHNTDIIKDCKDLYDIYYMLSDSMPEDLGVCRIHVAGDFLNASYFKAWAYLAAHNPDKLFYAYTKSINYWVSNKWINELPNFILTASYGGRYDNMIELYQLRSAKVIFHPNEANGLEIDHDDSHAANPEKRNEDFALMLHGTQPKNTEASKALWTLKKEKIQHAYRR